MKRNLIIILSSIMVACAGHFPDGESRYKDFAPDGIPFTIADSVWNMDMLGNHRAIVNVTDAQRQGAPDAVKVTLTWRRPDLRPETKKIVVIDAQTKQEIKNVSLLDFSSEKGVIAFQPQTVPGTYKVYYLPAKFRRGSGDARYGKPWNDYLLPEYATDPAWEKEIIPTSFII